MSKLEEGKKLSEEHKKKIGKSLKGNIPWNKGKVNSCSEETRRKISEAGKGKKCSDETKAKMSEVAKNRTYSEETRKKLSDAAKGRKSAFKGKHHTDETKQKLREANLGKKHTDEAKRKVSEANLGKVVSAETRKKISEGQMGEKNHQWIDGNRVVYPVEFNYGLRMKVKRRDGFVCQECGKNAEESGFYLHVHHIDYDKMNSDLGNLITLCVSCHAKTNNSREDWTKYYMEKMGAAT